MDKYTITIYKSKGFEKLVCEVKSPFAKVLELAEMILENKNVIKLTIHRLDLTMAGLEQKLVKAYGGG